MLNKDKEIKSVFSVKEFNEACKEYFKHRVSRFVPYKGDYPIVGISFCVTEESQFKDPEIRGLFGRNVCILDESIPLLRRYCKFTGGDGRSGVFIGIEITEEDFYYMLENKATGKIEYESCCGGIEDCFPGIDY